MIVFCGGPARAKQITQTSPYRQAILNAYYQEAAIIDAVTTLDANLFKDPGLMNLRVQIIVSNEEQKQQANKKQSQQTSKKQIKKEQDESQKKGQKKVDKKKAKGKKQEEKKEEKKKKYKLKNGFSIFFAVKDESERKQMKKSIIDKLEMEGISVIVQNFEDMKYKLRSAQQKCIIISHALNQLEQLLSEVNHLQLTIRLFEEKKHEQMEQDGEVFLNSVEEVIQKLKNNDIIE